MLERCRGYENCGCGRKANDLTDVAQDEVTAGVCIEMSQSSDGSGDAKGCGQSFDGCRCKCESQSGRY
jgi:hypothetical protein